MVGRIGRPHGTRGAVVVDPYTDDPASRFSPGSEVHRADGSVLTVRRYEATDRAPIITFAEVADRSSAEGLRGEALYIPSAERRPLEADEFWPDELVGLEVVTVDGAPVGTIAEVQTGYAQDRLVVDTPSGAIIIPLVAALVPKIDVAGRRVEVDLPDGFTE